jgi:hypothetical protein
MLSGCSGSNPEIRASGDLGRGRAGLAIERQPDACGQTVPHVRVAEGAELRSLLKRERAQLDVANDRIRDCYQFNEELRAGLVGSSGR